MGFEIKNGVLKKYTEEDGVSEVVIPDSVTSIGDSAFEDCSSLTSITIPDSVTSIGRSAFSGCSKLTSIKIPDSVTSIGWGAFSHCSKLTSITIPDSVTSIGEYAFVFCSSLTSITVPVTVTYGYSWFPNDHTFWLNNTPIFLSSDEDGEFVAELTYKVISGETITAEFLQKARRRETKDPIYLRLCRKGQEDCLAYVKKSIMRFAKDAIDRNCISELKEFESYGFITKSNAGKLAEYAIEKEKQNNEVIICLLEIMDRVAKLKLEQLDKFLEKAQGNVEITAWLLECKNKHFTVDEIDKIETEKMEKELGLKERTLAEWKKIFTFEDDGSGGFKITGYKGEETQIIIPDVIAKKKVTAIEEYAFSPEKERLAKKVKDIRSKITSVFIPDTVTSIGDSAFKECRSLASITMSELVTSIGDSVFKECRSLASITMPESVTSIGDCAFCGCSKLTCITIPDTVTSIGDCAFTKTKWLKEYPDDFVIVNGILIKFKGKKNIVTIPNTVTSIGDSAFYGCKKLTSITIPDSVTSIEYCAFNDCSSLTSITIPDSVTSIGDYAFWRCGSLISITIPDSVTSIGKSAFSDCSSLTSITIPDSVTSIGSNAFWGCRSLTSITIPDSVISIGDNSFRDCRSLTSITIPDSVTIIGENTFFCCSSMTSITIPDSVTSIGNRTFSGCDNLTIYASENSYAIEFAKENNRHYQVI